MITYYMSVYNMELADVGVYWSILRLEYCIVLAEHNLD
jgi:hypothetical protein